MDSSRDSFIAFSDNFCGLPLNSFEIFKRWSNEFMLWLCSSMESLQEFLHSFHQAFVIVFTRGSCINSFEKKSKDFQMNPSNNPSFGCSEYSSKKFYTCMNAPSALHIFASRILQAVQQNFLQGFFGEYSSYSRHFFQKLHLRIPGAIFG